MMSKSWTVMNKTAEELAKSSPISPMPSVDHLTRKDFEHVYEPSDDTFLFLDALTYEYGSQCDSILNNNTSKNVTTLEIGCGTGTVSVHFAKLCQQSNNHNNSTPTHFIHHVTDINPHALNVTKRTAIANGIPCTEESLEYDNVTNNTSVIRTWQCDLASALLNELPRKIDVLFFNPPYVCTPNEEVNGCGIEASWAGGEDGRIVLDRALPQISQLLAFPHGVAYVITIDENKPREIAQIMDEKYGIVVEPLMRRKCKNEYLTLQKMTHKNCINRSTAI